MEDRKPARAVPRTADAVVFKEEVPAAAAGLRLDRYLAQSLGSRARAQSLIDEGLVRVDGQPRRKRHLVSENEVVEVLDAQDVHGEEVGQQAFFEVVYEDEHMLVVDKPPGVVVHPAKGHRSGTLAQALSGRAAGGESWRAGIVHRLDRDTSGLLVVAKSDAIHRALKEMLSARRIRREYLALVEGHPPARTGTIDAPIGRHRRDRIRVSIDTDEPREARTQFEVRRLLPASSLLLVWLETGRTHQIRVHMGSIGHPVCGDPLYGVADRYGLRRQFLHASRLAFEHPVTGQTVEVSSPLPDDLENALRQAERNSRRGGPSTAAPPNVRTEPPEVGEGRFGPRHGPPPR